MRIRVIAHPPDEFARWVASQRQPAAEDQLAAAGRERFFSTSCVNCHAIQGTSAKGTFGPDLTHLMSRETLGSGAAPNTPEKLRAWVRDPQAIKEGCLGRGVHGGLRDWPLPMLPSRRHAFLGSFFAPLLWSALVWATLDIVNPALNARIDWGWFIASQVAFGLVAGYIVHLTETVETMQSWPLAARAGLRAPGPVAGEVAA